LLETVSAEYQRRMRRFAGLLLLTSGCVTFFRATPENIGDEHVSPMQARHYASEARNSGSVASAVSLALTGSALAFGTAAGLEADRTQQFGVIPILLLTAGVIDLLFSIGYSVSAFQARSVALDWEALIPGTGNNPAPGLTLNPDAGVP
jgi:hypothetical protein